MLVAALLLQAAVPPPPAGKPEPCRWEERANGTTFVHFGPERRCAAWTPPRHRIGVWMYGFEDSHFVEGAATVAEAERAGRADRTGTWLDFDGESGIRPGCRPVLGQAYLIEFDGLDAVPRKEEHATNVSPIFTGFGHMGMFKRAVLIDHIRSMVLLGPMSGDQVRPAGPPPSCDWPTSRPINSDNPH